MWWVGVCVSMCVCACVRVCGLGGPEVAVTVAFKYILFDPKVTTEANVLDHVGAHRVPRIGENSRHEATYERPRCDIKIELERCD